MSEQSTPKPAAGPGAAGPGKDNVFTHKIGPLPMWGWVGIAAAALVAWRMFSAKKNASATSASEQAGSSGTGANTVPQFVNQTYTTLNAPAAPPTQEDPNCHPPSRKHAASGCQSRQQPNQCQGQQCQGGHGPGCGGPGQGQQCQGAQCQGGPQGPCGQGCGGGGQGGGQWQGPGCGAPGGGPNQGGAQPCNQDKDQDQGWRSGFTRGGQHGPSQESQRSGRGHRGGH